MSATTTTRPGAAATAAAAGSAEPEAGGKSKKKLFLVFGAVVVLAAAAAWFFLLRAPADTAPPEPVAGEVLTLEPISVNLAGGHYLRVGIALQVIETPEHEPEGSKALDLTISTLSGRDAGTLADPVQREAIKAELAKKVEEAYHHDVMGVYFTEFVTQ